MKYILLVLLVVWPVSTFAEALPGVTVWKDPNCGCCGNWIEHMKAAGFTVKTKNTENLQTIKQQAGIPEGLQSCHTALIGNYLIEGHVPAADIKRLLKLKPKVKGLAVPGMPSGSPGMESSEPEPYSVLSFDMKGNIATFSKHP